MNDEREQKKKINVQRVTRVNIDFSHFGDYLKRLGQRDDDAGEEESNISGLGCVRAREFVASTLWMD